jgi:adenylate kinase
MNLVLLGPPGAGKGTQAARLAAYFGLLHVATGDLFRQNLREGTPLGLEARRYMDQGLLVPDSVTVAMVEARIDQPDAQAGFVLDGFPRNLAQAEALDRILADRRRRLDHVLALVVDREAIVRRLTGRWVCPACQATYHVEFNPPRVAGVCDRCGTPLVQRADDSLETVTKRLAVYDEETAPLVSFYREREILTEVDGMGSVEDVTARLVGVLGG